MERKQTDYNKIVGRKDGLVYVLDYIFEDEYFKGATGSNFELLTQKQLDQRIEDYDREDLRRGAVENKQTTDGLDDWIDYLGDKEEIVLDSSYSDKDYVNEMLKYFSGKDEEEYEYTNCTGGGRCFNKEMCNPERWDDLLAPELLEVIASIEE